MGKEFQIFALTPASFLPNEADMIVRMFDAGLHRCLVRKPQANELDVLRLLDRIPLQWHGRLSLQDHDQLLRQFSEVGVHSGAGEGTPKATNRHSSGAIHHWHELRGCETLDEVLISPVFDSISKGGYQGNPALRAPLPAHNQNIIALGGITPKRVAEVMAWGYDGVAVLGYLWNDSERTIENFNELLKATMIPA